MASPESSSPAAKSTAKRLESLTGLRILFAVMVVYYHYCRRCGLLDGDQWFSKAVHEMGAVGVSGFFILSGYILVHVYRDRKWSARGFAVNRFARIYPLYFLALMLAFPLDWWTPGMPDQGKVQAFGLALMLLQSYFQFAVVRFNGPGWSLSVEALFYLLFPVLFAVHQRAMGAFYAIFTVAFLVAGLSFAGVLPVYFYSFFPLVRVWEFMLGMILASASVKKWKIGNEAIALILVLSSPFLIKAGFIGITFLGSILLSYLVWKFVEVPAGRFIRCLKLTC